MKIAGVYQFYLDYVLPRLNGGEEAGELAITTDKFLARIRPKATGDPLFPQDIDVSLSSMKLTIARADGSEGQLDIEVKSVCMDRIQVVLEWEADLDNFDADEELRRSLDRAVAMADYYISHYRYVASSPHVKPIGRSWRSEDEEVNINVPFSCAWFNAEDGTELRILGPGFSSVIKSNSIKSPESGFAGRADLEASLRTAVPPPLHRSLLIDSEGYVYDLALREAVLSMASACELAARLFVDRNGGEQDPRISSVISLRNVTFAERYYEKLPQAVVSKSFKSVDPVSFDLVQEMYRQRNSLMHRGVFKDDFNALFERDRQKLVNSWLAASKEAISWIDAS
ncbi:hypothetical protein [Lentzea aerocolonigenes]|uniref:hypothetical protein n=1 Tax=Lentzea aerocolonigenes TaxID=68170 RepID=UPI000A95BC29|nr:hypothetical protein [Lentzea aerocolonigenes]MCP2248610.1 hypothetical protein [Lentzea aerocolonigenes]